MALLLWHHTKTCQVVASQRLAAVRTPKLHRCTLWTLLTWKPFGLSCTVNESSPWVWLWSRMGHLGNRGSLRNTDLLCVDTFHYTMFERKWRSLVSSPVASAKLLSFRTLSESQWQIFSPKSGSQTRKIFEAQILPLATNIASFFFPRKVTAWLCSLLRKCLPNPQIWKTRVSLSVSRSFKFRGGSVKRAAGSASAQSPGHFPAVNFRPWGAAQGFMGTSLSILQNIKKTRTQGSSFHKN